METSKEFKKKLSKKIKKCQLILNKDSIKCQDDPSLFVAIGNSGLANGINSEDVLQEFSKHGQISDIILLPNKSYCFLKFPDLSSAEAVFNNVNGVIPLGQNGVPLILSYCKEIQPEIQQNPWSEDLRPEGLILIPEFIDDELEKKLLNIVSWELDDQQLKHRQVKHFGYEFLYGVNTVDPKKPLEQKIPSDCNVLWTVMKEKCPEFSWFEPDQMTINKYQPGQGIPPHADTHSPFLDPIVSLSLGSDIVMEFKRKGVTCNVLLKRKSMLIMSGESRFGWLHGITPKTMDIVPANGHLTTIKRDVRYSYTFRK
jgi:alkylated DNA repair protein alkB family protein 8